MKSAVRSRQGRAGSKPLHLQASKEACERRHLTARCFLRKQDVPARQGIDTAAASSASDQTGAALADTTDSTRKRCWYCLLLAAPSESLRHSYMYDVSAHFVVACAGSKTPDGTCQSPSPTVDVQTLSSAQSDEVDAGYGVGERYLLYGLQAVVLLLC